MEREATTLFGMARLKCIGTLHDLGTMISGDNPRTQFKLRATVRSRLSSYPVSFAIIHEHLLDLLNRVTHVPWRSRVMRMQVPAH
jgi:hypothetical protein